MNVPKLLPDIELLVETLQEKYVLLSSLEI